MTKTVDFTGSVSHGTLREQDLLGTFWGILAEYDNDRAANLAIEYDLDDTNHGADDWETWADENLGGDTQWLLEDLFDALGELAPEGTYFGAHPGDGSDFGFWAHDDPEEAYEEYIREVEK